MACGLLIDLFSAKAIFGFHALAYCLTTALLYGRKQHLFEDHFTTIPLLTGIFSTVFTLSQFFLLRIFQRPFPLDLYWLASDTIFMPLCDCIYALLCFTLPNLALRMGRQQPAEFSPKRPK